MIERERVRGDGREFTLETPDFWVVTCDHASGVVTRLTATFWVRPSKQRGLEFHGTDASLLMPTTNGEDYEDMPLLRPAYAGFDWSLALVDLAEAIRDDRPHRMGAEHAAHVVDVLNAADRSRLDGGPVGVSSSFDAPPPLDWAR
jgi:predicted dehydrogenase